MTSDSSSPIPLYPLKMGAIKPWGGEQKGRMEFEDLMAFCRRENIPTRTAFRRLPKSQQKAIIDGTPNYYGIRGFFNWLETKTYKMHVRVYLSRYRSYTVCPTCHGTRFKEEALLYRLHGLTIGEVYGLSVDQASHVFDSLRSADKASELLLHETSNRLAYLKDVGLGLSHPRSPITNLSGGEVQRVALTSALGSNLVNTLYILMNPALVSTPGTITV